MAITLFYTIYSPGHQDSGEGGIVPALRNYRKYFCFAKLQRTKLKIRASGMIYFWLLRTQGRSGLNKFNITEVHQVMIELILRE